MATKIQKHREEVAKNNAKMTLLKERNGVLERKIAEEESLEIRAVMRSENITLEELVALARSLREGRPAQPHTAPAQREDADDYDEVPVAYPAHSTNEQAEKTEDEEDDD